VCFIEIEKINPVIIIPFFYPPQNGNKTTEEHHVVLMVYLKRQFPWRSNGTSIYSGSRNGGFTSMVRFLPYKTQVYF